MLECVLFLRGGAEDAISDLWLGEKNKINNNKKTPHKINVE